MNVSGGLRAMREWAKLITGRARLRWEAAIADYRFPASAEHLLDAFRSERPPSIEAYAQLFRYFASGFLVRRSPHGAHASYAGAGSYNGPAMDRLEGYSRIAPMLAAWLHGGRGRSIDLPCASRVDLVALLREGILAGTNPESPEYWGRITHWSQAIVEAADIALALWLSRDHVWKYMSNVERQRVANWLLQVNAKRLPDNNWHLFVVQVNAVIASLGMRCDTIELMRHYARTKSFYRGRGWFADGDAHDATAFDYYNAWGFHYQLQWLKRIDPSFDTEFIDDALGEFVAAYKYLIGPRGFPMLGRSTCYRMAAPVPLVFAQDSHPSLVSPGQARRALDAIWQHFVAHGAVHRGNVTQGYFSTDLRLVEAYSGPASCLWSLRSLVAALALPDSSEFWSHPPAPLPVESHNYAIDVAPPGWRVNGCMRTGRITVETGHDAQPPLVSISFFDRIVSAFGRVPKRPKNITAKYFRARYESLSPYCDADK